MAPYFRENRFAPVSSGRISGRSDGPHGIPFRVNPRGGQVEPIGGSGMGAARGLLEVIRIAAETIGAVRLGDEALRRFNDPVNEAMRRGSDISWQLPAGREFIVVVHDGGTDKERIEVSEGGSAYLPSGSNYRIVPGTNDDPRYLSNGSVKVRNKDGEVIDVPVSNYTPPEIPSPPPSTVDAEPGDLLHWREPADTETLPADSRFDRHHPNYRDPGGLA